MRRGTTPKHVFAVEFAAADIKRVEITYEQNEKIVIKKTEKDCKISDKEIALTLSQRETLLFEEKGCVSVQLRVLLADGTVLASDIIHISCENCLSEEVLT